MKEVARAIDKYLPLWGSWRGAELIGQESGCELYRVYKEEWGKQYISTVKLLSFLIGQSDILEARTIGLEPAAMPEYFKNLVGNVQNEIELMYRLRGNSNIVTYEDHAIYEKKGNQGWDVLIRMEYLQPLSDFLEGRGMERFEVVRLGIDICKALEACSREGIIHRDIKDSSIFVSPKGEFKLGSFSMAKELMKGGRGALVSLNPLYMAPELYKEQGYDSSADIYSLGIVMYKLLNRGRLPFFPLPPASITVDAAERALSLRMSGKALTLPVDGSEPLGTIVLKACSYDKKDRYKSPFEFRQKLERFLKAGNKTAKLDSVMTDNASEFTAQISSEKEEADVVAAYAKELEKVAVVELAASVDRINNNHKLKRKRLLRNIGICSAVVILAFATAFFSAYDFEPTTEVPAVGSAAVTIQATPSPVDDTTPNLTATPMPTGVKSAEDHYKEGLTHMKNDRYWAAISAFEEAKKLGYEVKRSENQIRTAKKRIEVQKLNSKAMKYYEQQEYEKAISAFAELAEGDAGYKNSTQYSDSFFKLAEKHNLLGMQYYNEGKPEQSSKEFEAALGALESMKRDLIKYDQKRYNEEYGIYSGNKSNMLEKIQKIDKYIKLADEFNREGVKFVTAGSLENAKHEVENALTQLVKIELLVPKYKGSRYIALKKICEDNLKSIESKLFTD